MRYHLKRSVSTLTVVAVVVVLIISCIATIYFLSNFVFTSTASGEFLEAQRGLVNLADLMEGLLNVQGAFGSIRLSSWHGAFDIIMHNFGIYLIHDGERLTIYNGSTCDIVYYAASYLGGGIDVHGRTLRKGEISILRGGTELISNTSLISVIVGYDGRVDRWSVRLSSSRVLMTHYRSGTEDYCTIFILVLKGERPTSIAGTTEIKFSVVKVKGYAMPAGETYTLHVIVDGKHSETTIGKGTILTVIITIMRVELKPKG